MKRSRRGFSLMELISVIGMLCVMMMIMTPLLPTLLSEVPATQRAASTHRQIAGILRRIQQDMDRAIDLPAASGEKRAGDRTLLIRTEADTILYEWADGRLTRSELRVPAAKETWDMPKGIIRWRAVSDQGRQALEVRTAVRVRIGPREVERLAGSNVYYIDGLGRRNAGVSPARSEGILPSHSSAETAAVLEGKMPAIRSEMPSQGRQP